MMIRQVREEDGEALGRVFCFGWKEGYKGILPNDYLDALTVEICTPKKVPPQNYYVAESDGKVVGLVNFGTARDTEFADSGELRAIYVHPDHWQSGFGHALFDAAINRLAELGYPKFYLWVLRENARARHFYEKMGMQITADERILSIGSTVVTEVRYEMGFKT
ncbi:MAG: GNAT family N-acetyltransferase [Clostridia bacterium]|nr:GNAT family N-acetyltransferase [Clostridia bacterium]